jgi:hypothetical protein
MTLPQVTRECLTAVLEKSIQQDPQDFAAQVIVDLMEEQPVLMEGITTVLEPFMAACNVTEFQGQEIDGELRHKLLIMSHFCALGIALKALSAQSEAKEMEELWG